MQKPSWQRKVCLSGLSLPGEQMQLSHAQKTPASMQPDIGEHSDFSFLYMRKICFQPLFVKHPSVMPLAKKYSNIIQE